MARHDETDEEPTRGGRLELCDTSQNEVTLVGRLACAPEVRTLPSGDEITAFRVVVTRSADVVERRGSRSPRVDAIDCVAWRPGVRRTVRGWRPDDIVEVHGALRRRFWRSPGGLASRYEVEMDGGRVVRRAARQRAG